jgi:hypothetical protein
MANNKIDPEMIIEIDAEDQFSECDPDFLIDPDNCTDAELHEMAEHIREMYLDLGIRIIGLETYMQEQRDLILSGGY